MHANDPRLTVTIEQAAELLGIGRTLAYEAARSGQLPTLRIGRRLLVPRARLLELVGAQVSAAAAAQPEGGAADTLDAA